MPPSPSVAYHSDYLIEVSHGYVPDRELEHKFGRNAAVPNGSFELISNLSAVVAWPAAPTAVRIKAGGDAADTAAGAGAREVTVYGLNALLQRASETIVTAGIAASAPTATLWWRVDRAIASSCGAYATPYNTAAVVIENAAGTQDLLQIDAEESQTQHCAYSIAAGVSADLLSIDISVDAAKPADFRLFTRENLDTVVAPVSPRRLRKFWDGLQTPKSYRPRAPLLSVTGPCDIWLEAQGSGVGTEVAAEMELLLALH